MRDHERIRQTQRGLQEESLDFIICALPLNVLMVSGYWPVVGQSLAIASRTRGLRLLVPKDERELAERSWADEVVTFSPGSLKKITTPAEAIREPLTKLLTKEPVQEPAAGYEKDKTSEPATYSATHRYGESIKDLLNTILPSARTRPADNLLARLRASKTQLELERIRIACSFAEHAFCQGAAGLHPGLTETEAAALFRAPLSASLAEFLEVERAGGFAYCMSGANSAQASGAYARSRRRRIEKGDLVLVHCNSYADGYWTDITRTYCIGPSSERQRQIYDVVFAARAAAFQAAVPGVRAANIDDACRRQIDVHGFGAQFPHPTGHGIGFSAINPNAIPRLHPKSNDTIEPGMVFNVEPAIYIEGYGGVRHCDMVAMTENGVELLTNFQCQPGDLEIKNI